MLARCRYAQADSNLTVRDLAGCARVLPLHPYRMVPLFQKSRVIDNPMRYRLSFAHLIKFPVSPRAPTEGFAFPVPVC